VMYMRMFAVPLLLPKLLNPSSDRILIPKILEERKELVVKLCECFQGRFWEFIQQIFQCRKTQGNYVDAPTEGIRRVLEIVTGEKIPRGTILQTDKIGDHFICI
jgi:hypothetical protein